MRYAWALLIVVWGLFSTAYAIGCIYLKKWPWEFWHEAQPDMYDGKEPYEQWAARMHMARATQMKEEE